MVGAQDSLRGAKMHQYWQRMYEIYNYDSIISNFPFENEQHLIQI